MKPVHGLSIVVCCHNSSRRLPTTLSHLAAVSIPPGTEIEVLVVDNSSTDGTSETARRCWPASSRISLRVVGEPVKGLSHARRRALMEARYDLVSFIDDDNWVSPDWAEVAFDVLLNNPQVGACGGTSEAAFDVAPPDWFVRYQGNFAVGHQHADAGDVTGKPNALWGAGLTLRKEAWLQAEKAGHRFALTGRSGAGLTSGEDQELCFHLALCGWRLWYDPRLRLRHFMPAERLEWRYLRRLLRGAGWSSPWLDPYREALGLYSRKDWGGEMAHVVLALLRNPLRLARCCFQEGEGRNEIAIHELLWGRLLGLVAGRKPIADLRARLATDSRRTATAAPRAP